MQAGFLANLLRATKRSCDLVTFNWHPWPWICVATLMRHKENSEWREWHEMWHSCDIIRHTTYDVTLSSDKGIEILWWGFSHLPRIASKGPENLEKYWKIFHFPPKNYNQVHTFINETTDRARNNLMMYSKIKHKPYADARESKSYHWYFYRTQQVTLVHTWLTCCDWSASARVHRSSAAGVRKLATRL